MVEFERPLTTCEKVGTKIKHIKVGTEAIIVDSVPGGFKVFIPKEDEHLKLPFEKISEWWASKGEPTGKCRIT